MKNRYKINQQLLLTSFFLCFIYWLQAQSLTRVGSEFQVNTYTTLAQTSQSVAMDQNGNFIIVWSSNGQDGDSGGIYAQRYDKDGNPQGSEFRVHVTTTGTQINADIAVDASGNFIIVWQDERGGITNDDIYARRFNSDGTPIDVTEFIVNTHTTGTQENPKVAMDADGDFIVVWNGVGSIDGAGVFAALFDENANIQLGGQIQVNTTTTFTQKEPDVAMDTNGNFTVVWDGNGIGGDLTGIFRRRYNSSGTALDVNEVALNVTTTDIQESPSIGMNDNGDVIIAWESEAQDGDDDGIFARRYNNAGVVLDGAEFQVNTYTTSYQLHASAAIDEDGDFVIIWRAGDDQDGSGDGIFGQAYLANGTANGAEFQVNTYTDFNQANPYIAMNESGQFITAYTFVAPVDGSSFCTHAQLFTGGFTYIVNTTNDVDDGICNLVHCSLREAINLANTNGMNSINEIHFNILGTAPFTIQPSSSLPTLQAKINLDATTQNDWSLGSIVLDGTSAGLANGITLEADNVKIKGFEIRSFSQNGIRFNLALSNIEILDNAIHSNMQHAIVSPISTSFSIIKDNYLGTDSNLANALGNGTNGIRGTMLNTLIEGNIITNNTFSGIDLNASSNNKIIDNYIGVNPFTSTNMGNLNHGILMIGSSNDTITNNFIAFNGNAGISITNALITENSIFCNTNAIINGAETAPIISTVSQTSITGTSTANHKIEIFLNDTTGCSIAPCQGKTLLGTTMAGGTGNWTLNAPYFTSLPPLAQITATATNTGTNNTSGFSSCATLTNDDCAAAFDLVVNSAACVGTTTKASNDGATSSTPLPIGSCVSTYNGGDIWFKAVLPFSGNMLIRKREGTQIQPVVEAYMGSCGSLTAIDCKTFNAEPNALIIDLPQDSAGNTIYFRVWDDGNDDVGDVVLSAHFLKTNPEKWEICGDPVDDEEDNTSIGASRRVANEFVVQYEQDTTGLAANNIELDQNENLEKSCICSTRTLQLWRTSTPDTVEISIDTALTLQNILQTSYNYIIGEQPCTGLGQRVRFPPNIYVPQMNYTDSVRVAIIDSGVDTEHPLLENAFRQNTNPNQGCLPNDTIGYDFVNGLGVPKDNDGHGTWVNGALVRGFPNKIKLDLMNMKFKEVDDGSLFDAICGIYHAIEEQAEIIILSWNFRSNEFPQIFFDALDEARKNGILVVTAAGNTPENNDNRNKYPSNFELDNILTVTSYEADLDGENIRLGHYASFGKSTVDIAALGFLETTAIGDQGNPFQLTSVAGTTLAAPLVARTAAILKGAFPNLTYKHIKDCILSSVEKKGTFKDKISSEGYLNHDQAILCAKEKAEMITNACATSNLMLTTQATPDDCNMGMGSIDLTLTNAETPTFLWSTDAITEDIDNLYAGNYKVTVTDASGCVLTKNINVTNNCMSLRERYEQIEPADRIVTKNLNKDQNINVPELLQFKNITSPLVIPNPFQNQLRIQLHLEEKEKVQIKIYDLKGQLWLQEERNVGNGHQSFSINTSSLPKGFFSLHLKSTSASWQQKIVKTE